MSCVLSMSPRIAVILRSFKQRYVILFLRAILYVCEPIHTTLLWSSILYAVPWYIHVCGSINGAVKVSRCLLCIDISQTVRGLALCAGHESSMLLESVNELPN